MIFFFTTAIFVRTIYYNQYFMDVLQEYQYKLASARLKKGTAQSFILTNSARTFINSSCYEYSTTVTACSIGGFIDNVMLTASVWTLGFSSLNRYFKITKPFAYSKLMNHRTCWILIFLIWGIAVITAGKNIEL